MDVVRQRLTTQGLVGPGFASAVDAVRAFLAVQAQDYRGALWGVGQRVAGAVEADVQAALTARAIVRTWPMRGTLHLVAAEDAGWLTRLLAPRIIARAASRYRQLGLDAAAFARSGRLFEKALAVAGELTRAEMFDVLARGGVSPEGQRGVHVLGRLAMEGLLCFGAPRGKQQTLALRDAWIPGGRDLRGDEALGEVARRYIAGHAPARLVDLAWWAGLTATEARRAVDVAGLAAEGGLYGVAAKRGRLPGVSAHLLPAWDTYTVAYRDRGDVLDPARAKQGKNGIFSPIVLLDGHVAGTWTRTLRGARVNVEPVLFVAPLRAQRLALDAAVARYARFLGAETA